QAAADKQVALYQAYRARLAAAGAALQNHDVADAARHLAEAPRALRDWEWRHLHSRLDDSSAAFPTPGWLTWFLPGGGGRAGLRWVVRADQDVRVLDEQGNTERSVPLPKGSTGLFAVTPEGVFFLDPAADGVARVRDETGKVRLSVPVPAGAGISRIALSA